MYWSLKSEMHMITFVLACSQLLDAVEFFFFEIRDAVEWLGYFADGKLFNVSWFILMATPGGQDNVIAADQHIWYRKAVSGILIKIWTTRETILYSNSNFPGWGLDGEKARGYGTWQSFCLRTLASLTKWCVHCTFTLLAQLQPASWHGKLLPKTRYSSWLLGPNGN